MHLLYLLSAISARNTVKTTYKKNSVGKVGKNQY